MPRSLLVALLCAACARELDVPAALVADVELVVAPPPGIHCLEVALRDHDDGPTFHVLPFAAGRVRLRALPVAVYTVTARAYADCAAPPLTAPWETAAPATLILAGPGSHTLVLELRRPTRLQTVTTLEIPWRGTFLANAWGDFLGDGSTTILFGGPSWQNERTPFRAVRVARDGALTDVSATLLPDAPAATHARRALALDLNGDGRLDFFSANHGWDFPPFPGETQTLLLSQPDGTLADASATLPAIVLFAHSAAAGDLRGVGRPDLLVGELGMQPNPGLPPIYAGPNVVGDRVGPFLLRNDGVSAGELTLRYDNVSLPPPVAAPGFDTDVPGMFTASLFADVDGDAALDLVVASLEGSDRAGAAFVNDGAGGFAGAIALPFPVGTFGPKNTISVDVVATDLEPDGDVDLLLSQTASDPFYAGRRIQILVNDGAGGFSDETEARLPGQSGAGNWAQFLFLVDLDGDRDDDLLLQVDNPRPDGVLAYVNDGAGHFAPAPPDLLPAGARRSLVPADFNHDGRMDLVSFSPAGGTLTVTAYRR